MREKNSATYIPLVGHSRPSAAISKHSSAQPKNIVTPCMQEDKYISEGKGDTCTVIPSPNVSESSSSSFLTGERPPQSVSLSLLYLSPLPDTSLTTVSFLSDELPSIGGRQEHFAIHTVSMPEQAQAEVSITRDPFCRERRLDGQSEKIVWSCRGGSQLYQIIMHKLLKVNASIILHTIKSIK